MHVYKSHGLIIVGDVGWGESYRGGICHTWVGWIMQGRGGSYRGGIGHVGWGGMAWSGVRFGGVGEIKDVTPT